MYTHVYVFLENMFTCPISLYFLYILIIQLYFELEKTVGFPECNNIFSLGKKFKYLLLISNLYYNLILSAYKRLQVYGTQTMLVENTKTQVSIPDTYSFLSSYDP